MIDRLANRYLKRMNLLLLNSRNYLSARYLIVNCSIVLVCILLTFVKEDENFLKVKSIEISGNNLCVNSVNIYNNLIDKKMDSIKNIGQEIKKNPCIEDIIVRRKIPNELIIKIKERRPIGVLAGSNILFDKNSVFFTPAPNSTINLPTIFAHKKDINEIIEIIKINPNIKKAIKKDNKWKITIDKTDISLTEENFYPEWRMISNLIKSKKIDIGEASLITFSNNGEKISIKRSDK